MGGARKTILEEIALANAVLNAISLTGFDPPCNTGVNSTP